MTIHQNAIERDDQQIELVPVARLSRAVSATGAASQAPESREAQRRRNLTLLAIFSPTLLLFVYFLLFAANRYESLSTFVVRSPSATGVGQIANLIQGSAVISAIEDAYIVNEYIMSPDAMHALIAEDGLLEAFAQSGWDPVWAAPGTFRRSNEDRLLRYYRDLVRADLDKTSGISTLRVQAFTPEDSQRIATALLQKSERLLNRLNERAQTDAVSTALKQVDASKERALEALQKVTDFRNREEVIDPKLQSTVVLETIAGLAIQIAQANAQLTELQKASPENPQIASLKIRIAALDNQISRERARFGGSAASLAPQIAEYERLALEREFAERAFVSALTTFEAAKTDADRRRTYLEQIAQPSKPDYARYPWVAFWLLAIAGCNLALFWIIRHFVNDIVAHGGK